MPCGPDVPRSPYASYVHAAYIKDHRTPGVDFATLHIWPKNWGWYDEKDKSRGLDQALLQAGDYLAVHEGYARQLRMPLLLEEFGFPRNGGACEPGTRTSLRDEFYQVMLDAAVRGAAAGGPLAGALFWGWGGEGRPREKNRNRCGAGGPPAVWQRGDALLSDPPHESQGWYSVFDSDASTLDVLKRAAAKANALAG